MRTFSDIKNILHYVEEGFIPRPNESITNQAIEYFCDNQKTEWAKDFNNKEQFFVLKLYCKEFFGLESKNITLCDMRAAHKDISGTFTDYFWHSVKRKY